MGILVNLTAT